MSKLLGTTRDTRDTLENIDQNDVPSGSREVGTLGTKVLHPGKGAASPASVPGVDFLAHLKGLMSCAGRTAT